jgi:dTDP-4-amino-4,6-dideoxygalactose transaminase
MHPYVPPTARVAVGETLRTRWIGQGPRVREFEHRFSERLRNRAVAAVGSGTDALHLAYLLVGIKAGDEVLVPLFTCTATNIPLLWMGAKIRLCDVAPGSLNVDPHAVAKLVTERTKAIVVVHYGGAIVDVDPLLPLGLPVIEDAAQALGADIGYAHFSCFSFQAVKHVTTGDGGMLALPASKLAAARRLRWFGIDREAKLAGVWANDITEVGYKYQMTDIAAAMGLAGLNNLDAQLEYRRSLVARYCSQLADVPGLTILDMDPRGAAWLMTIAVENREGLKRKLAEQRIESDQVHYRNDRYSIFAGSRGKFPNMDALEDKYLVLPLHMHMRTDDVLRVCSVVKSGW